MMKVKAAVVWLLLFALSFPGSDLRAQPQIPAEADVIVYGGTSGAVMAAVQVRKMGKSVLLISPDKHLGGMTSGGLGCTDLGHEGILGGLSREFYHRVWKHYRDEDAWVREPRYPDKKQADGVVALDDEREVMYVFEPKVAEAIFDDLVKENQIPVVRARLDLRDGVAKEGARIRAVRTEDGREFHGKMFIDATYEGDLMAKAGVSYTLGREDNSQYGETINGLQTKSPVDWNQLPPGIDPYVVPGDPSSGLLPGVNPAPDVPDGTGDRRIQAYCYRMCLTDVPANRVPIEQPESYREEDYEILFRAIETGKTKKFFKTSAMPNRKTDSNNQGGISCDYIGMNYDYPEGDYATRERIARAHRDWQLGLVWTLQHHPRVPKEIRNAYARWGLPEDEFTDNGHWPHPLYVREARRMTSDYVLTQPIIQKSRAERSVGMGAYTMDSHNVQRLVGPNGDVRNEGDVQQGVKRPYQIDYGTLIPKQAECENLLVTFCISASHMAFGSFRMEPVLMIVSQSAATAAVLALEQGRAVQEVPYEALRARLEADQQVLGL